MTMSFKDFVESAESGNRPAGLAPPLIALWHERRGEWDAAHEQVQDESDKASAWVHAYLHRREGDISNAAYWYRAAERPVCRLPLDEERDRLLQELLDQLARAFD